MGRERRRDRGEKGKGRGEVNGRRSVKEGEVSNFFFLFLEFSLVPLFSMFTIIIDNHLLLLLLSFIFAIVVFRVLSIHFILSFTFLLFRYSDAFGKPELSLQLCLPRIALH